MAKETLGAHLRNLLTPYKNLLQLVKDGKVDEETIRKYNLDNLDDLIAFSNSEAMEQKHSQEPASEDLEDALKAKVDEELKDPVFGKLINTFAAYAFAKQIATWQKKQDEKNIGDRLWEAYLKGEIETKEQLMNDAIDATIDIIYTPTTWQPDIVYNRDKLKDLCKDKFEQGDKVKVIIIKE